MKSIPLICGIWLLAAQVFGASSREILQQLNAAASAEIRALQDTNVNAYSKENARRITALSEALELTQGQSGDKEPSEYLAPAIQMLAQSASAGETRELAKSLLAQLGAESKERKNVQRQELERLGQRCADEGLAAKTARELDAPLQTLTKTLMEARTRSTDPSTAALFQYAEQLQALQHFLQARQDYFLKMESGNRVQAIKSLRHNTNSQQPSVLWIPRSAMMSAVQRDIKAAAPGADDPTAKLNEIGPKVMGASSAKEIDPLIEELRELEEIAVSFVDDFGSNRGITVRNYLEFTRKWQEFLAARESGDNLAAHKVLVELVANPHEYPGVARSQILAQAYETTPKLTLGAKKVLPKPSLRSPEAILEEVKTLEDMQRLMPELKDAAEINPARWGSPVSELETIVRAYRQLRTGTTTSIAMFSRSTGDAEPVTELRSELALLIFSRQLAASEKDKPKPGEDPAEYLKRMLTVARARKDWNLASRVISTAQGAQMSDILLLYPDSAAISLLRSGLSYYKAHQYALAVNAFELALKNASDLVPTEDIGWYLDTIKKEFPEEYENGTQLTINPPPPPPSYLRPFTGRQMFNPDQQIKVTGVPAALPQAAPSDIPAPAPPPPAGAGKQ